MEHLQINRNLSLCKNKQKNPPQCHHVEQSKNRVHVNGAYVPLQMFLPNSD